MWSQQDHAIWWQRLYGASQPAATLLSARPLWSKSVFERAHWGGDQN